MTLSLTWDLESIFEGGSESPALADFLATLQADVSAINSAAPLPPLNAKTRAIWVDTIEQVYDLSTRLQHGASFIGCLVSQNVKDTKAVQLMGKIDQIQAQIGTIWTRLSSAFAEQDDAAWAELLTHKTLKPVTFHLNAQRDLAQKKMERDLEVLANELATDGYHAWGRLYTIISGEEEVTFQGETMSLGQLYNTYMDHPNRETRQQAFTTFEEAWGDLAQTCAMALNYQAGFRLTLYKHRDWSILQEPLQKNRLSQAALETMWAVIDAKSAKLHDYFAAKAKLMGVETISWFDVAAPVGESPRTYTYEEAAAFVVENLRASNPDIADFAQMAINQSWIESENRPGKRAGGYCTNLPLVNQTRIFITYNGSYNGLLTLAHELGHAYHRWVMRDLPYGATRYAMSVAETASIYNQSVVSDAALQTTTSPQERLSLLGANLNDAATFLMNLRARFDFERAFFEKRTEKQLSVDELNDLMVQAQKTAFKAGLDLYHPLFWAAKLHFYLTRSPFYNFPYTFGYLFSNGVYARAVAEGSAFKARYIALLRDTGSMTTEALAQKHLGVDLSQPEFWETAVDRVLADIDPFVKLVNRLQS